MSDPPGSGIGATTMDFPRLGVGVTTAVLLLAPFVLGGCADDAEPAPEVAVVVAHHDTELPPALSDGERAEFTEDN